MDNVGDWSAKERAKQYRTLEAGALKNDSNDIIRQLAPSENADIHAYCKK